MSNPQSLNGIKYKHAVPSKAQIPPKIGDLVEPNRVYMEECLQNPPKTKAIQNK